MIARFCRGPEGSSIVRMASANDWSPMYASLDTFRAAMLRSRKETFAEDQVSAAKRALPAPAHHQADRLLDRLHGRRRLRKISGPQRGQPRICACLPNCQLFSLAARLTRPQAIESAARDRPALPTAARPSRRWPTSSTCGSTTLLGYLARILPGLLRSELVFVRSLSSRSAGR